MTLDEAIREFNREELAAVTESTLKRSGQMKAWLVELRERRESEAQNEAR